MFPGSGILARCARRIYWQRFETGKDGTHSEFRNVVNKLASHIVQEPQNQVTVNYKVLTGTTDPLDTANSQSPSNRNKN